MSSTQRKVALDKPCGRCGQPIYYGYKGPTPGLCGRCGDRLRPHQRGYKSVRRGGRPAGQGSAALWGLLAVLALAAIAYTIWPFLTR